MDAQLIRLSKKEKRPTLLHPLARGFQMIIKKKMRFASKPRIPRESSQKANGFLHSVEKNRQSAMVAISHSGRQIIQGRFPIATSNPQRGKGGRRESLHRGFLRIGQDSRKGFPASGDIRQTCSLWHGRSDHESRTETCARGMLWSATLQGKHSRKSRKARLTPSARRAFGAEPVSL